MKIYKIVQSTLDDMYKIHITTKWFGVTVWTAFYCADCEYGPMDISWSSKEEAAAELARLTTVEKFIEIKD